MSGEPRVVDLRGTLMTPLLSAIPVIAEQTGRPVVLVGGLAVICRLHSPYRATSDLDTVDRRPAGEQSQLELLVAAGATASGPSGVLVPTRWGPVQVDVLQVSEADMRDLPDDPTDRLHVLAHAWAATTATELVLSTPEVGRLTVAVAEPGALIAMKLQSIMNRGAAKEGTDLLDIVRLSFDQGCGPISRMQLEQAEPQRRADALLHARHWFQDNADRSLAKVRAVFEGRDTELDDLHLVGDLLVEALHG